MEFWFRPTQRRTLENFVCVSWGAILKENRGSRLAIFFYWKIKNFIYDVSIWVGDGDFYSLHINTMEQTRKCLSCGQICKNKLCRDCENKKHNASAIISQNCIKLKKLLNTPRFNIDGFDRFLLYTENIIRNMKDLLRYKDLEKWRLQLSY